MTKEIKQEIIDKDVKDGEQSSSSPVTSKIILKETKINEIELYKDDISQEAPKTKKQRLEEQYSAFANSAWYDSIESWYVSKKWELVNKPKLYKEDELVIKLLNTIASDLWYNDTNKEFIIWTWVKPITNQSMLNR